MPSPPVSSRRLAAFASAAVIWSIAACGAPTGTDTTAASNTVAAPEAVNAADPVDAAAPAPAATGTARGSDRSTPGPTAARIDSPAVATTDADRKFDRQLPATCDFELVEALAGRHPDVAQFVTVASDSWTASTARLELAARGDDGVWVCQSAGMASMVGRSGTRPLVDRRSGDGTTPAGVFPLGTQTAWDGQRFQFFGNQPDPGVRGAYRAVQHADCWGATPGEPTYQQLYARADCPGPDDEWLPRFGDVYSHAAVIGANLAEVSGDEAGEPAYAAAIFLHRHNYAGGSSPRPTSGCVSLEATDLVSVLRSLDPALNPHFAIGERTWLIDVA